ncbi:MAG: hypothetical protein ACP5GZ_10815 [Vulcanisaeta sp.]|uniref:hypothetical protein n=1 Tax=Vulcanisaeta sp. TaxID=2020871 RepID=UPI003D0A3156
MCIIIFNLFHLGVDHALPRLCRILFAQFPYVLAGEYSIRSTANAGLNQSQ